jgi:hypothetical protein
MFMSRIASTAERKPSRNRSFVRRRAHTGERRERLAEMRANQRQHDELGGLFVAHAGDGDQENPSPHAAFAQ